MNLSPPASPGMSLSLRATMMRHIVLHPRWQGGSNPRCERGSIVDGAGRQIDAGALEGGPEPPPILDQAPSHRRIRGEAWKDAPPCEGYSPRLDVVDKVDDLRQTTLHKGIVPFWSLLELVRTLHEQQERPLVCLQRGPDSIHADASVLTMGPEPDQILLRSDHQLGLIGFPNALQWTVAHPLDPTHLEGGSDRPTV